MGKTKSDSPDGVEDQDSATMHEWGSIDSSLAAIKEELSEEIRSIGVILGEGFEGLRQVAEATDYISIAIIIFAAVFGPLIGSFSAYKLNRMFWVEINERRSITKIGESIIYCIDRIEDIAPKYWLQGYNKETEEEQKLDEIKIRSSLKPLETLTNEYSQHLTPKGSVGNREVLEELHRELWDISTGGDFETKIRQQDFDRANEIHDICTQFRLEVMKRSPDPIAPFRA